MKKVMGVIVNPIAGLGGRVGLKGTDGSQIAERARDLGAAPDAPRRATEALCAIARGIGMGAIRVVAAPRQMGYDEARAAGLVPTAVGAATREATTAEDTVDAARRMADLGVDLLLFAGGDGTARDISRAVGETVVVVGVPAGVKMHSAVYATSPRAAAELAARYLRGEPMSLQEAEVMDVDEEAFRRGSVSAKLYGYLRTPYESGLLQGVKRGSTAADSLAQEDIALDLVERMCPGWLYVLGPGTNTRAIARRLGVEKTLLGVDVVTGRRLVRADATEALILDAIQGQRAKIVVTPIGGQGHIFGRGNQQISPRVIRRVGRENILLVATPDKLTSLRGDPLLVDTGDAEVDAMLAGYFRVVTGYGMEAVCRVSA